MLLYNYKGGETMSFQENLKRYREQAGFKQAKEFAHYLGIPYTRYMAYENKGSFPNEKTLISISTALHVSIDELLGYQPNEEQQCIQFLKDLGLFVSFSHLWRVADFPPSKSYSDKIENEVKEGKLHEFPLQPHSLIPLVKGFKETYQYKQSTKELFFQYLTNERTRETLLRLAYNQKQELIKKYDSIIEADEIIKQITENKLSRDEFSGLMGKLKEKIYLSSKILVLIHEIIKLSDIPTFEVSQSSDKLIHELSSNYRNEKIDLEQTSQQLTHLFQTLKKENQKLTKIELAKKNIKTSSDEGTPSQ